MHTLKGKELSAEVIARNGMGMVADGRVRNHKLGNSAQIHTGEIETRERQIYRDFLPSKNCCMVYDLTGSDFYE